MAINHVILELYCGFDKEKNGKAPLYYKYGSYHPGYHCLENSCESLSYIKAPSEIAYSDSEGESEFEKNAWIGFGGDMNPESFDDENNYESLKNIWEEICKRKIQESYNEYMKRTEGMRGRYVNFTYDLESVGWGKASLEINGVENFLRRVI
ncbi:hypothetical protein SAMN04487969_113152 [Paenibacillus algorifonticola]|uniref:Uncharacterized protein n=1 Tax=Paenibacillus algorifonticola TaxID=684063 RepID=A0A1I2FW60_9BACL|nr:hypothetical protein [Paenibacillus algorifonticola]SFF09049.1 hypothetical protein SAMN04487969_113152 [Paenibacillus algorifonticola]